MMKQMNTIMLPDEAWWGGSVNQGHKMPLTARSTLTLNFYQGRENDQFAPLYISSKGRYIWSERPFTLEVKNGVIECRGTGDILLNEGFGNLRGAYLAACHAHFPFAETLPDRRFFTQPQYNTWIELGTDQTTDNILRYAHGILEHGLPAGILMIDGGWQEDYGVFEFHKRKIPDPSYLIYELHQMGFGVMLWTSPIVSSAGTHYKQLRDKGYLLLDKNNEIAIRKWWSGYSAVLDLSNPEAAGWYHRELHRLMDCYGVDGFKFDAGDVYFYQDTDCSYKPMLAREQTAVFNEVGSHYALNEFRAAWKFGGQPIVARLHDKYHSWNEFGLNTLIPHTLLQGMLGYAYCCPDMVGGGILDCFNKGQAMDEELFVRWAQANAFMGMMQMSVAPWRVLSEKNAMRVIDALKLHASMGETFYALAQNASKTGEPITRHMAYVFPGQGFEHVDSQFMLGDRLLVAPVLEKGATEKSIHLPNGHWRNRNGEVFQGGRTITLPITLDDIPHFERLE